MADPAPALTAETRALKEAYDALNRNDLPGFFRLFDPDVVRTEPSGFPGEGTYHGLEAMKAHATVHRGKWAEGGCEPERFLVAGDRVIAFVHVRVRLKDETAWREGDVADGFRFRGGLAVEFHTFTDVGKALDWAGVAADH
jgi:hypothetical protein